jgi:hypothetical protein
MLTSVTKMLSAWKMYPSNLISPALKVDDGRDGKWRRDFTCRGYRQGRHVNPIRSESSETRDWLNRNEEFAKLFLISPLKSGHLS